MMEARRQFVNLLERNGVGGYSLRRMNAWKTLFYPSTQEAEAAAAAAAAAAEKEGSNVKLPGTAVKLPRPIIEVASFARRNSWPLDLLGRLGDGGRDSGKILFADDAGRTLGYEYDRNSRVIGSLPPLNEPKLCPISVSVNDDEGYPELYVMDRSTMLELPWTTPPSCSFEVLICRRPDTWCWQCLPRPRCDHVEDGDHVPIYSYTALGSTICFSALDGVTYHFDTRTHVWRRRSGRSASLPFHGKAEYVPELSLHFGFTEGIPHHLCAADLAGIAMPGVDDEAPMVHVFRDLDPPEGWRVVRCSLVSLGAGRFCVAKFLHEPRNYDDRSYGHQRYPRYGYESYDPMHDIAVLTGVEVVRCGGGGDQSLRLVKHKSRRYQEPHTIEEVL